MLPPQLRAGSRSTASSVQVASTRLSHAPIQHTRAMSFRRGSPDWLSHLDPIYHRFTRYRTLKTRAKLIATFKRRSNLTWDPEVKPFFTPKQFRFASHWGFNAKPGRWQQDDEMTNEETKSKRKDAEKSAETGKDDFELTRREKEWKEHVEAMKKRIQMDPYEAVFGRRFEPFWSPLLPSWIRGEMDLRRAWPSEESNRDAPKPSKELNAGNTKSTPQERSERKAESNPPSVTPEHKNENSKRAESKTEAPQPVASYPPSTVSNTPPKSYSTYSSTSWDSWTQKTRRTTWDSISGQTKRYEYDPISNRMVQVDPMPTTPLPNPVPSVDQTKAKSLSTGATMALKTAESQAVEIPVKKSTGVSTPVAAPSTNLESAPGRPTDMTTLINSPRTSVPKPVVATTVPAEEKGSPSKPVKNAKLAKMPEHDLDLLSAETIRAKMGKVKGVITPDQRQRLDKAYEEHTSAHDVEIESLLKERASKSNVKSIGTGIWDHAELDYMLHHELAALEAQKKLLGFRERSAFHVKALAQEYRRIEARSEAIKAQLQALETEAGKSGAGTTAASATTADPIAPQAEPGSGAPGFATGVLSAQPPLKVPMKRTASRSDTDEFQQAGPLQSAVDRMASKPQLQATEFDDSAAHEASEPLSTPPVVPSNWDNQANLLQADRVKRTASRAPRWIDDMRAKKEAYESRKANVDPEEVAKKAEVDARTQKIQKVLDEEIRQQKLSMQAYEGRWQHHISKQMPVFDHPVKGAPGRIQRSADALKAEKAQVAQDQETQKLVSLQGEGDFSPTITKFAGSDKWYKKPANGPSKRELDAAAQKARDQQLVREVKSIYEDAYGTISLDHRQPTQVLTKDAQKYINNELAWTSEFHDESHRKEAVGRAASQVTEPVGQIGKESCLDTNLAFDEVQIAAQERAAHEAQSITLPDPCTVSKLKTVVAQKIRQDHQNAMPQAVPSGSIQSTTSRPSDPPVRPTAVSQAVAWEEPPLYKVLAYDSGNDMFSTATTTSNFTGSERPISIPTALSQLYQPARFVPHFAALQKEGFQVIYGTKDLLVFKKVKTALGPRTSKTQRIGVTATRSTSAEYAAEQDPPVPLANVKASESNEVKASTDHTQSRSVDAPRPQHFESKASSKKSSAPVEETAASWPADRRKVRREEDVFTGSKPKWSNRHVRRELRHLERESRRSSRRRRSSTLRWMLIGGTTFASMSYLIGSAAEKSRNEYKYVASDFGTQVRREN